MPNRLLLLPGVRKFPDLLSPVSFPLLDWENVEVLTRQLSGVSFLQFLPPLGFPTIKDPVHLPVFPLGGNVSAHCQVMPSLSSTSIPRVNQEHNSSIAQSHCMIGLSFQQYHLYKFDQIWSEFLPGELCENIFGLSIHIFIQKELMEWMKQTSAISFQGGVQTHYYRK